MAPMNRNQRARYYLNRILEARDPVLEMRKIFLELDTLVYAGTNKHLDGEEQIRIIEELEKLIKELPYDITESESSSEGLEHFQKGDLTASDNSDILDVISAMKRTKGGK